MLLVTGEKNLVMHYGAQYILKPEYFEVYENDVLQAIAYASNKSVGRIIETNEPIPTDFIFGKYKFENGKFVIYENWIERYIGDRVYYEDIVMSDIAEMLLPVPRQDARVFAEKKALKTLEMWKKLTGSTYSYTALPPELLNGIILFDKDVNELSKEEQEHQKIAINMYNKLVARYLIEIEVGDTHDLIADMSKKISMLTRLVTRFIDEAWNGEEVPAEYKESYKQLVRGYVAAVDAGQIKDRGDLEDNGVMFQKLTERDFKIQDITDKEYFSKKEG